MTIEVWTEPALQKLAERLPLADQEVLFGFAPSKSGLETLAMEDLQPVIHQLQFMDPEPGEAPLTPPSVDKLEKNRLSSDAAGLLRLGRRKEALVETWFTKNRRPDLGERIAEAFRRRYARVNDGTRSPDEVFGHLQQYAAWAATHAPSRRAGCPFLFLRAVRHFRGFRRRGRDLADQAHSAGTRTARRGGRGHQRTRSGRLTMSKLWDAIRCRRSAVTSNPVIDYRWFVLTLDLLYTIRAIEYERGVIRRAGP